MQRPSHLSWQDTCATRGAGGVSGRILGGRQQPRFGAYLEIFMHWHTWDTGDIWVNDLPWWFVVVLILRNLRIDEVRSLPTVLEDQGLSRGVGVSASEQ